MVKENTSTISVRLTEQEKEVLLKYAEQHDLSMSQVVRKALKELIKLEENN